MASIIVASALAAFACVAAPALAAPAAAGAETFPGPTTITDSFAYTGAEQTFTVPAGIFQVNVLAIGGNGGNGDEQGGNGAQVNGKLNVIPGQTLYIEVGGNGQSKGAGLGGFNGGGSGGGEGSGGGGGASDVRTSPLALGLTPEDRLIVAGGGGGGGANAGCSGGAGGQAGENGQVGSCGDQGGEAGTQTRGGKGGNQGCGPGESGRLGAGGNGGGAGGAEHPSCFFTGGGGGAGYFGGGGGSGASSHGSGGGGGGSSLVPAGGSVTATQAGSEPRMQISFEAGTETPTIAPTAITGPATTFGHASATLSATVNPNGETVSDCRFEYGETLAYERSVPCSSPPGSGTSQIAVSADVEGLDARALYHFRISATNATGTSHGEDETFSTSPTTIADSFAYTGAEQTFTVPAGIFQVNVLAIGGNGGNGDEQGGNGAQVNGKLNVIPGQTLYIEVGGNGQSKGAGLGGFNGGGSGGGEGSGGGGGASDVRTSPLALGLTPEDRLIVAGGGGGGGANGGGCTGGAGGQAGENGQGGCQGRGGEGALQARGGKGGSGGCGPGEAGALGIGGSGGGNIGGLASCTVTGGGGGGGYYGGGGGGGTSSFGSGGGGGGSSLVPAGGSVTATQAGSEPRMRISYEPAPEAPAAATGPASGENPTGATLNGTVDPNGQKTTACDFEYGATNEYGSSVPCSELPGAGESAVPVSGPVAGLEVKTTYHYRLSATDATGASHGEDETFTTLPAPPTIGTEAASAIAQTTATLNGTVNPNGGNVNDCHVEYGLTEAYGHSAPCSALPGSGEGPVAVSASIAGLEAKTGYHYRFSATNVGGTGVGGDQAFETLPEPPTVTAVGPVAGLAAGGTEVTISGTELTGASAVSFGGASATGFTVISPTSITAIAPPGMGTVEVTVTTSGGASAPSVGDRFEYVAPGPAPVVKKLSVKRGPASGMTSVTIAGAGFTGVTSVRFGSVQATGLEVVSKTSITVLSPIGTSGVVDVTVTTPNGTSATSAKDRFKYLTPTIAHVSPSTGSTAGGTNVTVAGSGFAPGKAQTKFLFGRTPATSVECQSTTICTVASPAAKKAGPVDIRAITSGPASAKSTTDHFTYSGG
jgi:hypothetical protein